MRDAKIFQVGKDEMRQKACSRPSAQEESQIVGSAPLTSSLTA